MKKIFKFNMIEIALSIAIIAIGLSSLLVLFPIGINATRAAMEESIAPEMTEFVTNYVRSVFLKQWESEKNSGSFTTAFTGNFPASYPADPVDFSSDGSGVFPTVNYDASPVKIASLGGGVFKYTRSDENGEFTAMVKIWTPAGDLTGTGNGTCRLFIPDVIHGTDAQPQNTQNSLKYDKEGTEESLSSVFQQFAQSVLVEISWGGSNFDENKQTFRVEVYNPYYALQAAP